jgi:hypothetical protein
MSRRSHLVLSAVAALSLSAAAFALPAQGQQQPSTAIAELAFPGSVLR